MVLVALLDNLIKTFTKKRFIIHEHHAEKAHLHYDIRLEKDGVLKSWACRKIVDLITNESKRILLIQTPDHDLNEWINFKGVIEDGYGKGPVFIWDKGKYIEHKWTDKSIVIEFFGKKIKGSYAIIPFNRDDKNHYLMIKTKDDKYKNNENK